MTRPIRNTGPCFPTSLPRQRDVLSHTEFYKLIFCMLSVSQAIPFELPRKPPTVNRWDTTLGTPGGDKYYNQYRPQCEVCPRDHGKVVESLRGVAGWKFPTLNVFLTVRGHKRGPLRKHRFRQINIAKELG